MSLSPARLLDTALEATIVGSFTKIGPAVRGRLDDWAPLSSFDLRGRSVLVTGGNGGLGTAACELLAETGATVHFTVRSEEKGEETLAELRAATGRDDFAYHLLDLMDLDAVRSFAADFREQVPVLDGLLHNAGAMFEERDEVEGVERTVLLHVVAPFLLTNELLPALRASEHPGRVVWLSSGGMYSEPLRVEKLQSPDDYGPSKAYARAKRAQVVLTDQLAARLGDDVVVSAMHPGWASTPGVERSLPTFNKIMGPLFRDPRGGADTAAWLIAAPEPVAEPGKFWLDRRTRGTAYAPGTATRPEQAMALWAEVTELAGLDADVFQPA